MSRYTGPKARHCRRLGVNIYESEKYDKILAKRNYAPGMHGQNTGMRGKKTEFAKQLAEKQKARFMFGVSEKQFRNYYQKADRSDMVTGESLLQLLERRIDNVLFRAGFSITRAQSRQMVSHGLFLLNGKRITIPSIQVKVGDKIEIRTKNTESPLFEIVKSGKAKTKPAQWLKVDPKNLMIEILNLPVQGELEKTIESQLIVEFYSKS